MQSAEIPHLPVARIEGQSRPNKVKSMMDFRITLPDQTVYSLTLPSNSTGQDCLDEVSIIEHNSFCIIVIV